MGLWVNTGRDKPSPYYTSRRGYSRGWACPCPCSHPPIIFPYLDANYQLDARTLLTYKLSYGPGIAQPAANQANRYAIAILTSSVLTRTAEGLLQDIFSCHAFECSHNGLARISDVIEPVLLLNLYH